MRIARFVSEFKADADRGLMPNYHKLSLAQRALGNDVSIFAMGEAESGGTAFNGIDVTFVKKPPLARVFLGGKLMDALLKSGFDARIVHSTNPMPLGWLFPHYRKKTNAKFALSLHGSLNPLRAHGHGSVFAMRDSLEFPALAKFLARRVDIILPVADFIKRELLDAGVPEQKIKVVPSGVDFAMFSGTRPKMGGTGSEFTVLYTGRLAETKGIAHLLQAAALLKGKGIKFRLVGGTAKDGGYAGAVSLAGRLGVNEFVEFLPPVSHGEMPALYAQADAFVLPSFMEGRSKVLWEAMAAGVPAIATACGGTLETIRHGENGLLVPVADAEAIAEAIMRLRNDGALCRRLARRGRATAKGFDWKIVAKQYLAAFEAVL
ncbi:MAG: glycosyltransferase [Candidatus Diapherotrites archaeon]